MEPGHPNTSLPDRGKPSLFPFSWLQTMGTKPHGSWCCICCELLQAWDKKPQIICIGWRAHFQFPCLTNCKFHFHSPSFPHHNHPGFSTAHQKSVVTETPQVSSVVFLPHQPPGLQRAQHLVFDVPFSKPPPNAGPMAHSGSWRESHTGRQAPGLQSWLCP